MEKRPESPEFGKWDSGGDVQYTEYFEKKGKGRNGGKRKPNDPKEPNYDSSQSEERKVHHGSVGPGTPKGPPDTLKSSLEEGPSREEGEVMRRGNDAVGRKPTTVDSQHHHHRHGGVSSSTADGSKRATRTSTGSDRSVEQSPLHPHQPRIVNRGSGVSSQSSERKGSSAESGHGVPPPTTPGRSRLRSVTRGEETPDDNGPTVPIFGDWDERDPKSAEGFTEVFERVRDEKNSAGKPLTPNRSSNERPSGGNVTSKGCFCFPWGRK